MTMTTEIASQAPVDAATGKPVNLLQDTVHQFEKVIGLERSLLYKSIAKLKNDLEEATADLSLKEEELLVWEERLQLIQKDNEKKLQLAKERMGGSSRWQDSRKKAAAVGSSLDLIAEGDEEEDAEHAEEIDDTTKSASFSPGVPSAPTSQLPEAVTRVNSLSQQVVSEMVSLRRKWNHLVHEILPGGEPHFADGSSPRFQSPRETPGAKEDKPAVTQAEYKVEEAPDNLITGHIKFPGCISPPAQYPLAPRSELQGAGPQHLMPPSITTRGSSGLASSTGSQPSYRQRSTSSVAQFGVPTGPQVDIDSSVSVAPTVRTSPPIFPSGQTSKQEQLNVGPLQIGGVPDVRSQRGRLSASGTTRQLSPSVSASPTSKDKGIAPTPSGSLLAAGYPRQLQQPVGVNPLRFAVKTERSAGTATTTAKWPYNQ